MGNILERFGDIVKANVNAVLDKMEDPSKMIDQYLRDMLEDLAEVKKETAGVMAEEARTKRLVDANVAEVAKYEELAKKALLAANEDDARVFLSKKQELEAAGAGLHTAYAVAHGHHGHIGAQGKEPHPHNQEDGPQQEHHQGSHGHVGGQGKA